MYIDTHDYGTILETIHTYTHTHTHTHTHAHTHIHAHTHTHISIQQNLYTTTTSVQSPRPQMITHNINMKLLHAYREDNDDHSLYI